MHSLVLIGHGSHLNGESAAVVYRYAERLRAKRLFHEVIEGYWKEEPSLRQVLRTTACQQVTVIPMFISEGYFTETVIPRELGLSHQGPLPSGGIQRTMGGKTVHYTLPYGVHPRMTEVILARAREVLPELEAHGEQTALIVLGQGTARSEHSHKVIYQHVERLRELGLFAEVHALFLDEHPKVNSWPELVQARRVVVVPFFATEGWHTLETIPEDMGLSGPETIFPDNPHGKQTVYYTKPVGTHSSVLDVLIQLVEEARAPGEPQPDPAHQAAWEALLSAAGQGLRLAEVLIQPQAGELYELRHALDEGRPGPELRTLVTPEGLLEVTRRSDTGEHRPVRTIRTLPRHWRAVLNQTDLRRGLHHLYPAVVEETHAFDQELLRATPWSVTARRQTGRYARVQKATPEQLEAVTTRVCGTCLRTRVWAGQTLDQSFFKGVPGGIPCLEACTYLVTEVREAMDERRAQLIDS